MNVECTRNREAPDAFAFILSSSMSALAVAALLATSWSWWRRATTAGLLVLIQLLAILLFSRRNQGRPAAAARATSSTVCKEEEGVDPRLDDAARRLHDLQQRLATRPGPADGAEPSARILLACLPAIARALSGALTAHAVQVLGPEARKVYALNGDARRALIEQTPYRVLSAGLPVMDERLICMKQLLGRDARLSSALATFRMTTQQLAREPAVSFARMYRHLCEFYGEAMAAPPIPNPFANRPHAKQLTDAMHASFGWSRRSDLCIVVTLPSEAATSYSLVRQLLQAGMTTARINCAHDDAVAWTAMAAHVRRAVAELGGDVRCVLHADLAGSKNRIGPIAAEPAALKIAGNKDHEGVYRNTGRVRTVLLDARVRTSSLAEGEEDLARIAIEPLSEPVVMALRAATADGLTVPLLYTDKQGRRRTLHFDKLLVVDGAVCGLRVRLPQENVYFNTGRKIAVCLSTGGDCGPVAGEITLGAMPDAEPKIELHTGELLEIRRLQNDEPHLLGRPPPRDGSGRALAPALVSTCFSEFFSLVRQGQAISFDDGTIPGTVVRLIHDDTGACTAVVVEIGMRSLLHDGNHLLSTYTLKSEKGINIGEYAGMAAVTPSDVRDLAVVGALVDNVAISFCQTPADVAKCVSELSLVGRRHLGLPVTGELQPDQVHTLACWLRSKTVVPKIETEQAVANLVPLILTARTLGVGVAIMLARGDLAVETSLNRAGDFNNLLSVTHEVAAVCRRMHVPLLCMTQYLELEAKKRVATRPGWIDALVAIQDVQAAIGLNKGPHIAEVVAALHAAHRSEMQQSYCQ